MRTKILFGVVTLAVFAGGPLLRSYIRQIPQAVQLQSTVQESAPYAALQTVTAAPNGSEPSSVATSATATEPETAPEAASVLAPAMTPYDSQPSHASEFSSGVGRHDRSLKDQVLIVGGSAAAGGAIGATAAGGKGAAVGAVSGGAVGLIYDLLTKKR